MLVIAMNNWSEGKPGSANCEGAAEQMPKQKLPSMLPKKACKVFSSKQQGQRAEVEFKRATWI